MPLYHSTDIRYLTPLFKIVTAIGSLPLYNFEKQTFNNIYLYRLYSILVMAMMTLCNFFSLYGRAAKLFDNPQITVIFLDIAKQLTLLIFNVFTILNQSFINTKNIRLFFTYFMLVDKKMKKYHSDAPKINSIRTFLVSSHGYMLFLAIFDSYVWMSTFDIEEHKFYIFEYVQNYQIQLTVSLIYNLALGLKFRFECLNRAMMNVGSKIIKNIDGITYIDQKYDRTKMKKISKYDLYDYIKEIREMYSILSDLVEVCNIIFGWTILFLTNIVLFSLLLAAEALILNTMTTYPFIVKFIATTTFVASQYLLFAILVAYSCEVATKEAQKMSSISYKILTHVPRTYDTEGMREELLILAQQASNKYPYFSAAGFFKVDFTMLYIMLGSFASYVVVIIQFNTQLK